MSLEIPQLTDFSEASLDVAFSAVLRDAQNGRTTANFDAEAFRLEWLGRKQGRLKQIGDAWLKSAPVDAKKLIGQRFNALKEQIEALIDASISAPSKSAAATLDVTLPGTASRIGVEHPLVKTMAEIVSVFQRMGYSVGLGPDRKSVV